MERRHAGYVGNAIAKAFARAVPAALHMEWREHSDVRWGYRDGEGILASKRTMLVVTAGGWETHYGPRGINGPIDDLLSPSTMACYIILATTCCRPSLFIRLIASTKISFTSWRTACATSIHHHTVPVPEAEWRRLFDPVDGVAAAGRVA